MTGIKKIIAVIFSLTALYSCTLFAMNLSSYTVRLESFQKKIYSQKVSHYRLISKSRFFNLAETPFQKIIRKENQGDSTEITIQSGKLGYNSDNSNLKKYLTDTRYLNLKSPQIKKFSGIIKNKSNPVQYAENFVYRHISKKSTGIPLLPASVIIKNQEGDCTEHSILLISLLRGAGIPARAVTGMILAERIADKKNLFVYHMWVEAYYKGRWIMLDATRPGDKNENRYIAFCYHNLKTEMPLSYMQTISAIKNFRVIYLK